MAFPMDVPEYGEYVYWLRRGDKAQVRILDKELQAMNFMGWGEDLKDLPKAMTRFREMVRKHGDV